ncbi:MAG: serine/threonine-protein kinase [Coriobacteriia bacterium]|nr:serine/threonine-protein kinase [Coriobacteriia bacterium]
MAVEPAWLATEFSHLTDIQALDAGGQKEVFAARNVAGDRVVLKLFHATADPERAVRELNAVAGLKGSRVPEILEVGRAQSNVGEHIWFVEQFVEGETLQQRLLGGPQAPADVCRWAEEILVTLVAAQGAGIVHRDIKPANVILDTHGDAWLIDFGIARHLGLKSVTPTSWSRGPHSPGYGPPEQFENSKHEIDTRSDLFALGVVLYESIEGVNPYVVGTNSRDVVLDRVASMDLPRASVRAGVSDELADLIQSMTRRARSQRPMTAIDALEWLRES